MKHKTLRAIAFAAALIGAQAGVAAFAHDNHPIVTRVSHRLGHGLHRLGRGLRNAVHRIGHHRRHHH
jgi:hypothetical protein